MIVRRVGPLSLARIAGVLYAALGLIIGAIVSLITIAGGVWAPGDGRGMAGMLFGAAAVIILPIFYGILGFVGSLIAAALYNVVASSVGGVELDLQ